MIDAQVDVENIRSQIRQGLQGQDFGLNQLLTQAGQNLELTYNAAHAIFTKTLNVLEAMVDEVFKMDAAMTEFKKVSDLRDTGLEEYVDSLAEAGTKVARTGKPKSRPWLYSNMQRLFA